MLDNEFLQSIAEKWFCGIGCRGLLGQDIKAKGENMAEDAGWYNGYSWKERYNGKYKEMQRLIASGELPPASGPCAICGDAEVEVEYHDEDYSLPYRWVEPATYALCQYCHVYKLHQRFARPIAWQAFLAHVRRGGYARDLKDPSIKKEVDKYRAAIKRGESPVLRQLRPYARVIGEEWFANLRMDEASLKDPGARPRP
jgi:hypothetical protein